MSKGKKKALEGVMEYKEYINEIKDPDTKAWLKQFYNEYYANGVYNTEEPILMTEDHIKEARRNFNSLYRDAFHVTKTLGQQVELTDDQREIYELASDETDWESAFKRQDETLATEIIMAQAVRDIDSGQDKRVVLSRFYVKMKRLAKMIQQEKRKQRGQK